MGIAQHKHHRRQFPLDVLIETPLHSDVLEFFKQGRLERFVALAAYQYVLAFKQGQQDKNGASVTLASTSSTDEDGLLAIARNKLALVRKQPTQVNF